MSKNIYCIGKINKEEISLEIDIANKHTTSKEISPKCVDIVKIKMVKESSILYNNRKIGSPSDAYDIFKTFLEGSDREEFLVCSLDTKNQPTNINICSIGTLNSSIVHPREVFKSAILSNAASIIVGHNHPSGNPDPSNEDISITNRLKECGILLGIHLIDHIIIGNNSFLSLKEKGVL